METEDVIKLFPSDFDSSPGTQIRIVFSEA
jgi:hypothetical protein